MHKKSLQITIGKRVHQDRIPAASGMTIVDSRLFVVGDNSPLLFELDLALNIIHSTMIREYPVGDDGLIKKKLKPDFEAMASFEWQGQHWLLIIGSGSKADVREWAFMIDASDTSIRYEKQLTDLYQQFYTISGLQDEQTLNIEGLTVAGDHIYFFNRGNSASNMIFRITLRDMIAYMVGNIEPATNIETMTAQLPVKDTFEAGFSGADFWPEAKALIYSASVEATNDSYNDGEILGSYIGLISLADWKNNQMLDLSTNANLLLQKGKTLIAKVEAITLLQSTNKEAPAVLACDNDDGSSDFFIAKLTCL